jgi:hypothetical protein
MDKYDETLNMIFKEFKEKDEKDRQSRNLRKIRTDMEAIEYRNYFDNFYTDVTNNLINSIKSSFGKLPDSPLASTFIDVIDKTMYLEFLDTHLVLPHALIKLLDYQTNSRGRNSDIAKTCNLFALPWVMSALGNAAADKTKREFIKAYSSLINGLKNLNIYEAPFSQSGIETGNFLYWLIYDGNNNELNLNILIDLAEATKGSFSDFKTFIVAYWLIRRIRPNNSVKLFYSNILPIIK